MSIRHQSMIWEDGYYRQGDKAKLLVALAIADAARAEDGKAWPSIEHLARKARTSVRGVQEACRELEAADPPRISVELNKGPHGTNLYTVLTVPPQPLHPYPPQSLHPAAIAPRNGAAEKAAEKAALDCTLTISNHQEPERPVTKPSSKPSHAVQIPDGLNEQEGFAEEWQAFVKHRKKLRKPLTERAEELTLKKLSQRPKEAVFALRTVLEKGWQSFEWEWLENTTSSKNGHHSKPHRPGNDRNAGTLNDPSDYADCG